MNFYRNINLYLFFTAALIVTSSFIVRNPNKLPGSTITIEFKHFVDKELLVLDTISYKNDLGQSYTISKFKYYIGNIILTADDKSEFAIPGFHLINEEDDISKSIKHVNVPNKHFISLSFIIGVDSIHNCSGIQSGDLDPVKGMFWAWNTGYIFLKLEGNSPVAASPGNTLEYHIGGFHKPNCIRNVSLSLLNFWTTFASISLASSSSLTYLMNNSIPSLNTSSLNLLTNQVKGLLV